MSKFFHSEKGSVSLFLLMIIVSLFIFHAILIDYSRILLAKKQTEDALLIGLRSVLSSYDIHLQEKYGLFGLGHADGEKILRDVIQKNLAPSAKTFQFVQHYVQEGSIKLEGKHYLGFHPVYKHQILEMMKGHKESVEETKLMEQLQKLSEKLKDPRFNTYNLELEKKLMESNMTNEAIAQSFNQKKNMVDRLALYDRAKLLQKDPAKWKQVYSYWEKYQQLNRMEDIPPYRKSIPIEDQAILLEAYTQFASLDQNNKLEDDQKQMIEYIFHTFSAYHDQEIEYILYGFDRSYENMLATFTDLLFLRLTINSLDALDKCTQPSDSYDLTSCVSTAAIEQSIDQMKQLLRGDSITFSADSPELRLDYQEHLKLLFYIHNAEESSQLSRMLALTEYEVQKDLKKVPTNLTGYVENEISLWFFPKKYRIQHQFSISY